MNKSLFVCQSCGNEFPKWAGKCSGCGEWNTLVETPVSKAVRSKKSGLSSRREGKTEIVNLSSPSLLLNPYSLLLSSGISEFDRVLGNPSTGSGQGGFVPGQVILLAGEPGIGKSTLLLQVAASLGQSHTRHPDPAQPEKDLNSRDSSVRKPQNDDRGMILYVCGEESPTQIKLRASRLGVSGDAISLLAETNVDALLGAMENLQGSVLDSARTVGYPSSDRRESRSSNNCQLLIVDSIQTLTSNDLSASGGSVAQVKQCTARILNFVKEKGIPTILIGHVNKDGDIAGPKVLEHMVDTVMYLEGERFGSLRLLRCIKNRFGDVGEVGVFQMTEAGFVEVKNPSAVFIEERAKAAGSVVTVTMEGTRPVLLEVQALVTKTSFNYPRRTSSGYDLNRLYFICAVIEKHLKIPLQGFDVYVNVTGGTKITEPSADLAVCLAIVSSFKNKAASSKTVAFGELGLSGEVRMVGSQKKRESEAKKLGFTNVVSPAQAKTLSEAVRLAF